MKYIHRDNFRHLTGHGRDVAKYLDSVLDQWVHDNPPVPYGIMNISLDVDIGEFRATFAPNDKVYSDINGRTSQQLTLAIRIICAERTEITYLPMSMVLPQADSLVRSYQVYQHLFLRDATGLEIQGASYIGITKRGWRTRWAEHVRAANYGSHYLFHNAIRRYRGAKLTVHILRGFGLSERAAMDAEEAMVAHDTLYPLGLNMVPGGNAGLAYLRRIGAIGKNERIAPDDRQVIINRFFERTSRKGLPNPLAAANWLNSEYAEKVICSGPDRLKPQQIRDARYFAALGRDTEDIALRIGAKNAEQVARLIAGETYSRIR